MRYTIKITYTLFLDQRQSYSIKKSYLDETVHVLIVKPYLFPDLMSLGQLMLLQHM